MDILILTIPTDKFNLVNDTLEKNQYIPFSISGKWSDDYYVELYITGEFNDSPFIEVSFYDNIFKFIKSLSFESIPNEVIFEEPFENKHIVKFICG